MSEGHVALIVEDDPLIAEILKDLVTSLGHRFRHAVTLEDVRREIDAGGYCYVLLDMQFPPDAHPHSRASVGCGETALRLIRKRDARVNERGKHLLPVLIVTSYSRDPDFVSKMLTQMDADDFIAKPFGERLDLVLDKVRGALERAGREEHADCDGPGAGAVMSTLPPIATTQPATPAPTVSMAIDGTRGARKTNVTVAGEQRELQDSLIAALVPLVAAHLASPGAWSAAARVGLSRKAYAPHRIRKAFEDLLPDGFEVIEANKTGEFRLNPRIAIGAVAWEALVDHPEVEVQKVARERLEQDEVAGAGVTRRPAKSKSR